MKIKLKKVASILLSIMIIFGCTACELDQALSPQGIGETISMDEIPEYSGDPYIAINGNLPDFQEEDYSKDSFEEYGQLDSLGRCTIAYANIGKDLMPTEKRGSIGQVKPTGWQISKYDSVDGKYLYNRCHLIGYQLSGENANKQNLITGTRYMNVDGMLPFEDMVADYVKETGNHVLYRVTPIFTGDNLVADGVLMEAASVEDQGADISFNVFVYNAQPGITINYADGSNYANNSNEDTTTKEDQVSDENLEIRGNKNSKIYHCPGQRDYDLMEDSKNLVIFTSEKEAVAAGYRKAKN